jgi:hypothetical protein
MKKKVLEFWIVPLAEKVVLTTCFLGRRLVIGAGLFNFAVPTGYCAVSRIIAPPLNYLLRLSDNCAATRLFAPSLG